MTDLFGGRFWIQLLASAILALALPAGAATWHVEQDGSGDFTTIQAAVDSAADGDVIAIGPGHYSDVFQQGTWYFCVLVGEPKSLSFVGAGSEATIIGPDVEEAALRTYAFACLYDGTPFEVSVEGIRFVNSYWGVFSADVDIQVANCEFENCYYGVTVRNNVGSTLMVSDCEFFGSDYVGVPTAILTEAQWSEIERVEMIDWTKSIHLANNAGSNALIADCLMVGGGVSISDGPSATIRDCVIRNQHVNGLSLGGAGTVTFNNNLVEDCEINAIRLSGCSSFTMNDNIIQSSHSCFFLTIPCDAQSIHGNHFLRDVARDGYYVTTPSYFPWGPFYEDFTLNYWGTQDVDEISEWILDANDYPESGLYIVFEPMADGPVRVESRSWSDVKELFSGE
jgi:hypothetical protein